MRVAKVICLFLALINCVVCFATTKENIAKTIVRVHSGNKYSTGFFWKDGNTVLTTLHSLGNTSSVEVYIPSIHSWKPATVQKVYKAGDLLLLKVPAYSSPDFISSFYLSNPPVDTKSFTIGYNAGNSFYQDRDFSVGLLQGNTLGNLLPLPAQNEISALGFLSLQTEIVYLDGNLLHGFSGAPVVDLNGRLIGIADGGLENGAAGISWCINAAYITKLEASFEALPHLNQSAVNLLFASEEYSNKENGLQYLNYNSFKLRKVKTRTFAQLDQTADYSTFKELGLFQLIGMFKQSVPVIDYNSFTYDVYVEETTGATVVIPTGMVLSQSGGFLTAKSPDGSYSILIQMNITDNVQMSSVGFENAIMNRLNTFNWLVDSRLSFLFPFTRPDGTIINRKACYTTDFKKYSFEVLAAKKNVLLSMFISIENQLNPNNMMFFNASEVAKYNLAAQLTTFSN